MRKMSFQNENYYHIYNRGVDHRDIFGDANDFGRFIRSMRIMNNNSNEGQRDYVLRKMFKSGKYPELSSGYPELSSLTSGLFNIFNQELRLVVRNYYNFVEIISYCLNKNHYNLLLKQLIDKGVEKFLHKIGTSYTNYFNLRSKRSGSLFETTYKSAYLDTEGKIIRASTYINGNPEIHKICRAENWPWSSYLDYLGLRSGTMCNKEIILSQFRSIEEYRKFVKMIIRDEKAIKDELEKIDDKY
ncbi:MAG: transposase [Patescibacteria group bacterium]|nr:transposase [Patescibacteria group bacterium]